MKNKHTFIQFDNGYYSKEHEWILNNYLSGVLLNDKGNILYVSRKDMQEDWNR